MSEAGGGALARWLRPASIPNLICIGRILLVVPIVLALLDGRLSLALVLVLVAGASDGLDGYLAKRFNWRSRLGGILDPVADKLLLVSTFLALTITGLVPVGLTAVVILRDVVIVAGGLAYQALVASLEPHPSRISKINTGVQLLFLLATIAGQVFGLPPAELVLVLGAAVLITSVVSGLDYVLQWSRKALEHRG